MSASARHSDLLTIACHALLSRWGRGDFPLQLPGPKAMFSQSIRRKIIGIALGLVVLMVATSVLSMLMASRVGHLLDELTNKYVPAYGDLARANVRSLELEKLLSGEVLEIRVIHPALADTLVGQSVDVL